MAVIRNPIMADMVLKVKIAGGSTFLDVGEGFTEYKPTLSRTNKEMYFMNKAGGATTFPTKPSRSFKLTGIVAVGDPFQDAVLAHAFKFGTQAEGEYQYYDSVTKKGETGKCTVIVNDDGSGASNDFAKIDIDVMASGVPTAYTAT